MVVVRGSVHRIETNSEIKAKLKVIGSKISNVRVCESQHNSQLV